MLDHLPTSSESHAERAFAAPAPDERDIRTRTTAGRRRTASDGVHTALAFGVHLAVALIATGLALRAGISMPLLIALAAVTAVGLGDTLRLLLRVWPGTRTVAYLFCEELPVLRARHGRRAAHELVWQLRKVVHTEARSESCEVDADYRFRLVFNRLHPRQVEQRLGELASSVGSRTFAVAAHQVQVSPAIGFATGGRRASWPTLDERALEVLERARKRRDLCPVRYHSRYRLGRYRRLVTKRLGSALQVLVPHVLALGLPLLVYQGLHSAGFDVLYPAYLGVLAAIVATAAVVWIEALHALERVDPPKLAAGGYPCASAIIAAYLPNEADTVVEAVEAVLAADYPGQLEVVLAYNTPADHPVEDDLRELARRDPRFKPLRVHGSTSKAENVNAALAEASGAFIGLFDADHHPDPHCFSRAWRWLAAGYDVVQGHCVIRNGARTWLSRLVAVEFEQMYAVGHPGRARVHGFGIFGGSNGYWRREVLWETRLRPSMLTEDIDSTLRLIVAGRKIACDPLLVSRELAPASVKSLWNQRIRWAQGWHQVSRRHFWRSVGGRGTTLSVRQRLGLAYLLGWREIYPWISIQMLPILVAWGWRDGWGSLVRFTPLLTVAMLFCIGTAAAQALFTYRLAEPSVRRQRRWFVWWALVNLVYGEFKNFITRVAQAKEFAGERDWRVTARTPAAPRRRAGAARLAAIVPVKLGIR
jgi:cellulose synthase/poly-beta-1,6-N-acetylglucosamine synthase-like glycosyltransferase